jgi:L-ascorbate metabolism protein UlaG (beta-lactamase superfamily)
MYTRRKLLDCGARLAAFAGTTTILPFVAPGASFGAEGDMFKTENASVTVHPVAHATFVMETPDGVIYNDPAVDAAALAGYPPPDLILITHEHGDHYKPETLAAIVGPDTKLLTNPAVFDMLPADLKAKASSIANGASTSFGNISIEAVPAYNTTEDRKKYHPQGRDNGYVLTIDGRRVYIAGDTEDIPEMRALKDIYLAFLPMNLPFTMDIGQAAAAIAAFQPSFVYPYHYRGSDIDAFAEQVAAGESGTEVKRAEWYPAS